MSKGNISSLPQLQNVIKRDPQSYCDEFLLQYHHYKALLELFLLDPSNESKEIEELVMFLAQVSHCYPLEMKSFPDDLQTILKSNGTVLNADVRLTLCRSLILMRHKNLIAPEKLLELFFELFRCQDKLLRSTLYSHIVSDIKRINTPRRNNKVNNMLQNFMYSMLKDSSSIAIKMSLDVMTELYRKNIWNDSKTVNVIATACFSTINKVAVTALNFFLTDETSSVEQDGSDSESEKEGDSLRKMAISKRTCKGKKRQRKIDSAVRAIKKKGKKGTKLSENFAKLHLINDPQDFAERLHKKLESCRERFNVRVLLMNLISRLIGIHQLFLFNFYGFIQKYLQPHQRDVTLLLTFFAQSCHELVPPEVIEPSLRAVIDNFITERNSSEAIAVGLNTVREVCSRCPLAMSAELLQDLTAYQKYRDKSVVMAARSLINLYRSVNPSLLAKKDKGRLDGPVVVRAYGEMNTVDCLPDDEIQHSSDEENVINESHKEQQSTEDLVSVGTIESLAKRRKMDKEARLASIKAGRNDKDSYRYKKLRLNPNSSTTNKEKKKKKSFLMVKQKKSVRSKNKRSFREKQAALRNSLLKKRRT